MPDEEKEQVKLIRTALTPIAKEFAESSKGVGKDLGDAVQILARTAKGVVSLLKPLIWGVEQIEERFVPLLKAKLDKVPDERLIPPPLLIAGPVVDVAHPVPWTQVCLTRRA